MPATKSSRPRRHVDTVTGILQSAAAPDLVVGVPVHGAPKDAKSVVPAKPAAVKLPPRVNSEDGGGVLIGLPETGVRAHWWNDGGVLAAPDDIEPLDTDTEPGLEAQAGHGTFIAGLILQQAQAAGVWVERVLDTSGHGNTSEVGAASLRLAERGVDIINLSLGSKAEPTQYEQAMADIVDALHAINERIVIVAAAGNLEPGEQPHTFWPAAHDNVIAVGAVTGHKQGEYAWAEWSNRGEWVDFVAPGDELLSTYLNYVATEKGVASYQGWAWWSGTSFATAVVSGAIARTMTQRKLSAPDAVSYLKEARTKVDGVPVVEAAEWKHQDVS